MTIAFGAHRGRVCQEYMGGSTDAKPGLVEFGAGNETQRLVSGLKRINGVTEWGTAGASGNSHGRYWEDIYRPGIMEDGSLRECNGTLIALAQIAVPDRDNIRIFFGVHKDRPAVGDAVDNFLTATAAGVLTFVENDLAGFFYNSSFNANANRWRLVAAKGGGGLTGATVAPVLSAIDVEEYTNLQTVTPGKMQMLELNVVYDGTIEFRLNGDLLDKRPQAINPEENYSTVLCIQTTAAAARYLGVSYFAHDFRHYPGPVQR